MTWRGATPGVELRRRHQREAVPESVEALMARVKGLLESDVSRDEIEGILLDLGWSVHLARHFVDKAQRTLKPERARRGLALVLSGMLWVGIGLLAVLLTAIFAGNIPDSGADLIIWGTVGCGALRALGGAILWRRNREPSGAPPIARWTTASNRESNDFALLGMPANASLEQIRRAYRDQVKAWHPDRFPAHSQARARAEEKLKAINIAYRRLASAREASESRCAPSAAQVSNGTERTTS